MQQSSPRHDENLRNAALEELGLCNPNYLTSPTHIDTFILWLRARARTDLVDFIYDLTNGTIHEKNLEVLFPKATVLENAICFSYSLSHPATNSSGSSSNPVSDPQPLTKSDESDVQEEKRRQERYGYWDRLEETALWYGLLGNATKMEPDCKAPEPGSKKRFRKAIPKASKDVH